jgi:integrase
MEDEMQTWYLAQSYMTAKEAGWAKATYTNRWYHLRHFADACPELPKEPEPIEQFLATIPNPLYRYNHWCSIRVLYTWAVKRKSVDDPCRLVEEPKKPTPEPYWLEPDELAQLLNYPHPPRDKTLLYVLVDTGMRRGEAHSMTRENLHANAEGHGGWVRVTGKTGSRWVPMSEPVWAMLLDIAPASGPIWMGKRGPMGVQSLGLLVWQAFRHAGLTGDKMSCHRLRHTFATLWTGPDADAMDIGGWKDYRTYRIYRAIRPTKLVESQRTHGAIAGLAMENST